MHRFECSKPDFIRFEKIAIDLIFKGVCFSWRWHSNLMNSIDVIRYLYQLKEKQIHRNFRFY